jgi:hypothetical protein
MAGPGLLLSKNQGLNKGCGIEGLWRSSVSNLGGKEGQIQGTGLQLMRFDGRGEKEIGMRLCLPAATAVMLVLSPASFAIQDTPVAINGVETVCTGVGSAKDDPRWKAYPVKIVLATTGGADLANAHISLRRGDGTTVAETDCDAPWVLFKPPAGRYTATASLIGGSGSAHSASFTTTGSGAQKEITITFARPSSPSTGQ